MKWSYIRMSILWSIHSMLYVVYRSLPNGTFRPTLKMPRSDSYMCNPRHISATCQYYYVSHIMSTVWNINWSEYTYLGIQNQHQRGWTLSSVGLGTMRSTVSQVSLAIFYHFASDKHTAFRLVDRLDLSPILSYWLWLLFHSSADLSITPKWCYSETKTATSNRHSYSPEQRRLNHADNHHDHHGNHNETRHDRQNREWERRGRGRRNARSCRRQRDRERE